MYFSGSKLVYWQTLARYLRGERVMPVTWELDLTTMCNHNCPGCCGNRICQSTLADGEARRLVREIKACGGRGLILTGGGDPTMHREGILEVLDILPTLLFTNGELFDEPLARAVLPYLVGIRFSLDAYNADTAKKWRGIPKQRWVRVLDNVEAACNLKKEMGLPVTIGAGYLTDSERNHGIRRFAALCKKLGVDYAQCRPMLWTAEHQRTPDWGFKEYAEQYLKARYDVGELLTSSHQKYDLMLNDKVARPYSKCHAGRFATTIGADGKLYFCCHTRYMPEFCLGDLRKDGIEAIFASGRVEEIRDAMSFDKCPMLCRGDAMNRMVDDLMQNQPRHLEFL